MWKRCRSIGRLVGTDEKILSRAVMFGLNIVMDDARVEKLITAIKAGQKPL